MVISRHLFTGSKFLYSAPYFHLTFIVSWMNQKNRNFHLYLLCMAWSKTRIWDPGCRTLRPRTLQLCLCRHSLKSGPETQDHGTLRLKTLGSWDLESMALGPGTQELWDSGPWHRGSWNRDPDIQDSGTGSLGLAICDPETQNAESRTLRIELVTLIPSIATCTTYWINFNCEANFDDKKLGHLSWKLRSQGDGPKYLPKFFEIWHNTKKLENILWKNEVNNRN